jgi:hypothetical protein
MVTDFLEDDLVLTYIRPRLQKTISVLIAESLEPFEALETNLIDTAVQPGGCE